MSGKHNRLGENKPDSLGENKDGFEFSEEKNLIDIQANLATESCNKLNAQSITRWHLSKLEGYVSDEFRNIEFAD